MATDRDTERFLASLGTFAWKDYGRNGVRKVRPPHEPTDPRLAQPAFGRLVRDRRVALIWMDKDMAMTLKVGGAYLSLAENGRTVPAVTAWKILAALGVEVPA